MALNQENVIQWQEMTSTLWNEIVQDDRSLQEKYDTALLEYKDEARQAFINELGFEPLLEASMYCEYNYRYSLELYHDGKTSKESLAEMLTVNALTVKERILNHFPEQRDLALQYNKHYPWS